MKQVDAFKRDERGVRKMGAYAKRYSKTDTEPGKAADLEAILDVSIDQIEKRKQGRPPVYPDTDDGLIQFLKIQGNILNISKMLIQLMKRNWFPILKDGIALWA